MNTSLDDLRRAALRYAEAEKKHAGLVAYGAHDSARRAGEDLKTATRELVLAADLHAAREHDGIADLIRAGHTLEGAKRVQRVRAGKAKTAAPKAAKAAGKRKAVRA